MDKFSGAGIVEIRIYDDPSHPETSTYSVSLPITVLEAVLDTTTGKTLRTILTEQAREISAAKTAANEAKSTAAAASSSMSEIDNKLAGKANSEHTHTAAQISGLPTSLPANGGNADTLGGKTASEFASSSHNHDSRYYTETEMNTKLAGKSNTGHTHTASEVSGLPTSLPANGGNADTVGGHTVNADVPANAKFTDTTYSNASTSAAGLVSTGAQTFAGNKTFNGQIIPNGASACGTLQARKMASGTAAATSSNCPSGAWYGQYE